MDRGLDTLSDPNSAYSKDVVDFISAFLESELMPSGWGQRLLGAEVLYAEEFLDLWTLLPAAEKQQLFPLLDESYYRAQRPDLPADTSALADFFRVGLDSGISPNPLFDLEYMRFLRPDLFGAGRMAPGFFWNLFSRNMVQTSPYFDLKHVTDNRQGTPASPSILFDFLLRKSETSCSPSPFFDAGRYQLLYQDVPADPAEAFMNFVLVGDAAARICGVKFDPEWYRTHYAENGQPLESPLYHFLRYGRFARRLPLPGVVHDGHVRTVTTAAVENYSPDRSSATILDNHSQLVTRIAKGERARHEAFVTADIRPIVADDAAALVAGLSFEQVGAPEIDVIIPCYNEFEKTADCLASLAVLAKGLAVRVLLVDDCSSDPRMLQFAGVRGLSVIKNETNLHFLKSCNAAWRACSAPYVLLLNNDAQVFSDTLAKLHAVLSASPDIAAAAPMILYPNGRLQEAGCTIEANGDTRMIGVGDDPKLPRYQIDRDVAYGSGACLMVRRAAVGEVLFDPRFAPAYCEDVDLCVRLRQQGGRIRYVASARCVHHLSVSTGHLGEAKRVQLARRNQQKLYEKWGDRLSDDLGVRVLAFYLPQFHPVRENDLWWGKGFTEWTNVSKALPSFEGHYQPHLPSDLGFYDLRLIETMEAQMDMARRYGLHGFVMYYYNFQGQRVLDAPLRNLLARKDADFRFCLCWANENWTRHWDGGSHKHALMTQDYGPETIATFAEDAIASARLPGAITVNGKPLLLIYRPLLIPDVAAVCAELRARFAEAGFPGLYLAYVESMETAAAGQEPSTMGFDASVEFPPQGVGEPLKTKVQPFKSGFQGNLYSYEGTVANACGGGQPGYTRFPGVMPSWDNTARQPLAHTTMVGALPERFQAYVETKLRDTHQFLWGDERVLVVNAWNEWAEGAHLEPDRAFEHDWLRAIGDALDEGGWRDGR